MNKRLLYFIPGLLLIISSHLNAQNVEFKASNFKDQKDGFKTAVESLKAGNEQFEAALEAIENKTDPGEAFSNALINFEKAQSFNPNNAGLNYKMGKCIFESGDKTEAILYLNKAIKLNAEINPDAYFTLGKALTLEHKFEDARKNIKLYKTKLKEKDYLKKKSEINKQLLEIEAATKMIHFPRKRIWVDNLKKINSEYADYCAAITADEYMMIFNSERKDKGNSSDIYVSYRDKSTWSAPVGLDDPLNTDGEDVCLALSPDGQQIFVLKEENDKENIYLSFLEGDTWSEPEKLAENKINTEFNESHASFSYDGIKVYFVTDNPFANKGGDDIFFSGRIVTSHYEAWGKAHTIGSEINTIYDEGAIFMHPDGQTLYFSSKGHNSMGGYDIFKSTRLSGRWSDPENMGYPINTPYDEKYFVMSANGKHAYVTSNRKKEGMGDFDIYKVTFLGPEKAPVIDNEDHLLASFAKPIQEVSFAGTVKVESKHLTILKGRVLDAFTKDPVKADIEIVNNVRNEVIATFQSNSKTGKFLVSLPAGINYGIAVKAPEYLFHSENFNLPETSDYQLVDIDIYLKNVCIGCKIVLRNIFFATGKYTLRPESTTELTRLVDLINDIAKVKPGIKIEISGHTDNVGSEAMNQKLSENRAKAVVNYLTGKGISSQKLVYKGYGSTDPVSSNSTAKGRQENRRTEFKILED